MQNDLKDIAKNKYLPSFPYLTSKRSQKFSGLMLTLLTLSFFGFFAIKPTVSTILKLQKEVKDNQFVLEQLKTKIKNLTGLRAQYSNLQSDIPFVTNAITVRPDATVLFGQIQSIAQTSGISIKKLQNLEVKIINNDKTDKNYNSFSFEVSGSGSFENVSKFMQMLTNMERVIDIDTFSINNIVDQKSVSLEFDVQGTTFFKDNL